MPLDADFQEKRESMGGSKLISIFIIGADSFGANKLGHCLDLFFALPMQTFFLSFIAHSIVFSTNQVSDVQFSLAKAVC